MSHNPTEHVQEEITHHASHDAGSKWIAAAATTAAIVAAFAAAAGALATSHETQSALTRIKANDDWSYYQAKSIKVSVLEAKIFSGKLNKLVLDKGDGETPTKYAKQLKEIVDAEKSDREKEAKYAKQMKDIMTNAYAMEKLSRGHLEAHESFEWAATLFHIAIAIVAVAVVAHRKEFWYLSIVVGLLGVLVFGKTFLTAPPGMKEEEETPLVEQAGPKKPPEHGHSASELTQEPAEHSQANSVEP